MPIKTKVNHLATVTLASAGLFVLAGCDVDQTQEGRLPDVDVDVAEGQLPEYDVDGPDIDVGTREEQVEVPTGIDVETEERTIEVPDVDVDLPNDDDE
jgi:hypothetical protein